MSVVSTPPIANSTLLQPTNMTEIVFDFFHLEMVHYFIQQSSMQLRTTGETDIKAFRKRVSMKLESIGHSVGYRMAERWTRETPWINEQLDVIKFLCKEIWTAFFRKQIDKLQTNYKGIYVLHDASFRSFIRFNSLHAVVSAPTSPTPAASTGTNTTAPTDQQQALFDTAKMYAAFTCGMIRGVLENLGMNTTIKVDISKLPACQFTIMEVEKTRRNPQSSAA